MSAKNKLITIIIVILLLHNKQRFESRWMSVELCYVKTVIAFYKFYDFFFRQYFFMN